MTQNRYNVAVIYHSNDMDGIFSGEIIRQGLQVLNNKFPQVFVRKAGKEPRALEIQMVPIRNYNDPLPPVPLTTVEESEVPITAAPLDNWKAYDLIFVVDLSREDLFGSSVAEQVERPTIVWIDHHVTAIGKYCRDDSANRAGLSWWDSFLSWSLIDGVAACRLCFQFMRALVLAVEATASVRRSELNPLREFLGALAVWPHTAGVPKARFLHREVIEPFPVRLAGEYDVFDHTDPDAIIFQHGLKSVSPVFVQDFLQACLVEDNAFLADKIVPSDRVMNSLRHLLSRGEAVQTYMDQLYGLYRGLSATVVLEGVTFCSLNLIVGNSQHFVNVFDPAVHQACLRWGYVGKGRVSVSLFSDKQVPNHPNLGDIAAKFGGGGHAGAAGFETTLAWVCGLLESKTSK